MINGRLITPPGAAMVWLPRDGQVVAKIPPAKGNFRWLHETVRIRSPRLDGGRWILPRNCLNRLTIAAVDRYGCVVVCRDMSRLSQCTTMCLEATGVECNCSCMGEFHGEESTGRWFERAGDVVVADLGEIKRTAMVYRAVGDEGDAVVYTGQLSGRLYTPDRAGRKGWPLASRFMCAACLTERARVWDHCHWHGYVRAPLCNTCNTRHWGGWQPQHGRATPSQKSRHELLPLVPPLRRRSMGTLQRLAPAASA